MLGRRTVAHQIGDRERSHACACAAMRTTIEVPSSLANRPIRAIPGLDLGAAGPGWPPLLRGKSRLLSPCHPFSAKPA